MNQQVSRPVSSPSTIAAQMGLASTSIVLLLLVALHVLKSNYDPSWHMVSDYEIGHFGWMMQSAFLALALGSVAVALALISQVRSIGGRVGLVLLALSSIGMAIAGLNVADPVQTAASARSAHGNMHGLGFLIAIPSFTIGLSILTGSLWRNELWKSRRQSLLWLMIIAWLSLVSMAYAMTVLASQHNGIIGPGVVVGWPNRLYMLVTCVWMLIIAAHVYRLRSRA